MGLWRVRYSLFGILYSLFIRAIGASLRISLAGHESLDASRSSRKGVIYSLWHDTIFVPMYARRNLSAYVLVTHERHGEYISQTLRRLGFGILKGVGSRGGFPDIREVKRRAEAGNDIVVAPDGPHGPPRQVQPGVIYLAQKCGLSIIPVGVKASGFWRLPTWDGYQIPKPFARAVVVFGPPVELTAKHAPESIESMKLRLEEEMIRVSDEAARKLAS